jgi:hypothetical protein
MSIGESRSAERGDGAVADGGEMSATTGICLGLALALAIYAIGSALPLQTFSADASRGEARAEMSFLGP